MSRKRNSGYAALNRILHDPRASIPNDPPPASSSLHLLPQVDYVPRRYPGWKLVRSGDAVIFMQAGSVIKLEPTKIPALRALLDRIGGAP
jgi:hypothetical protein